MHRHMMKVYHLILLHSYMRQPTLYHVFVVGEGMSKKNVLGIKSLYTMLIVNLIGLTTLIQTHKILGRDMTLITHGVVRRKMQKKQSQIL